MPKKRIAILYSGQPRAWRECFPNHMRFLFQPNMEHEIDVFAHIWTPNNGPEDKTLHYFVESLYNIRGIEWEPAKSFEHETIVPDPRAYHPLNNIVSQSYSLWKTWDMMDKYVQEYGEYDIVVRTRTDNWFVEPLGNLSDYDPEGLHITDIQSHEDYALGDTFAWGDYDAMKAYCSMFPDFETMVEEGARVNPECLLGWAIKRNNISVHKHPIYPKLYRDV